MNPFDGYSGMVKAVRSKSQSQLCVSVVSTHLNIDDRDGGLGFVEVPSHPIHRLRNEVQHQIQIHLIFLERKKKTE